MLHNFFCDKKYKKSNRNKSGYSMYVYCVITIQLNCSTYFSRISLSLYYGKYNRLLAERGKIWNIIKIIIKKTATNYSGIEFCGGLMYVYLFSYVFRSKNTVYCKVLFQTRLHISIRYIGLSSGKSRKRQKGNKKVELKKNFLLTHTQNTPTQTTTVIFFSKLLPS